MNTHSYKVLEFDKLREELSAYSVIEENHYKIMNLSPLKDFSSLNRELDILKDFTDFIKYDGGFETAGMKDICKMTEKSQLIGAYLDVEDLWDINFNLRIFRLFKTRLEDLGKYRDLKDRYHDVPVMRGIEDIINKAIDNNKEIKDDASLDLRDLRIHKKTLSINIKRKFDELFDEPSLAKAFQERIITERDGRSVVPVKADFKGLIKGIEHDRSSSGQTVFIEPLSIVALNNKMRELELKEKEEIRKILLRITEHVRNNREDIDAVGEAILSLDILNARAVYGIEKNCVIPNINNKEMLSLVDARHPFIPADKIVPLTFEIGKDYNTLLITGPNTGGKTVALKTAGLLTLMALSGIPIPAHEHTSIGFFTGVYADIGDEQSIEQSLSSFSAHLKNVQEILESVNKSSLVLLDELGSGTDPIEGSAFAMAVIDYLRDRKCKSFITTHYSEVKAHGYNEEGIETASMEFDVNTLSPTYRLLIGIPGESNALTIAKRLGVSDEVIEKANAKLDGDHERVFIISDHGASRLAVIGRRETKWEMRNKGEHCGRCCKVSDDVIDEPNEYMTQENGYWVLANYDIIKGGRPGTVEVHGGASLEEVCIPIIEFTRMPENINIEVLTKIIQIGYKMKPVLKFVSSRLLSNVNVLIGDKRYTTITTDGKHFEVELRGFNREKEYSFIVLSNNNPIVKGLKFRIKTAGMSDNDLL